MSCKVVPTWASDHWSCDTCIVYLYSTFVIMCNVFLLCRKKFHCQKCLQMNCQKYRKKRRKVNRFLFAWLCFDVKLEFVIIFPVNDQIETPANKIWYIIADCQFCFRTCQNFNSVFPWCSYRHCICTSCLPGKAGFHWHW